MISAVTVGLTLLTCPHGGTWSDCVGCWLAWRYAVPMAKNALVLDRRPRHMSWHTCSGQDGDRVGWQDEALARPFNLGVGGCEQRRRRVGCENPGSGSEIGGHRDWSAAHDEPAGFWVAFGLDAVEAGVGERRDLPAKSYQPMMPRQKVGMAV